MAKDSSPSNGPLSIFNDSTEKKHYDFSFALPPPSPQVPMDVDTSGPIRLPEEPSQDRIAGGKKQKLNNGKVRRKIRKLADRCSNEEFDRGKFHRLCRLRSLVIGSLAVLIAVMLSVSMKEDLRNDFYKRYRRQYHLLLYGVEDYCSQEWDFSNVTEVLEERVVGQAGAIAQITDFFNEQQLHRFSSLALVGPIGAGKSLTANLIAGHFQWQSNVYKFFWDFNATPEKQYTNFQYYLHSIRHGSVVEPTCGHNLLIVDHLGTDDIDIINKIDSRLQQVTAKDGIQLTVLYVFQGSSVKDDQNLSRLNASIQLVFLRPLTEADLERCVRLEAKELAMDLDGNPGLLKELLASLNVRKYGCKGIRAKVSFYSQI